MDSRRARSRACYRGSVDGAILAWSWCTLQVAPHLDRYSGWVIPLLLFQGLVLALARLAT